MIIETSSNLQMRIQKWS